MSSFSSVQFSNNNSGGGCYYLLLFLFLLAINPRVGFAWITRSIATTSSSTTTSTFYTRQATLARNISSKNDQEGSTNGKGNNDNNDLSIGNNKRRMRNDETRRGGLSSRNAFFSQCFSYGSCVIVAASGAATANAKEQDPLDAFGQALEQQELARGGRGSNWPNSPSPLPTTKQSAQELTKPSALDDESSSTSSSDSGDSSSVSSSDSDDSSMTDLQKALLQIQKRKQIDPRTHG